MAKDLSELISDVAEARAVVRHVDEVGSSVRRLAKAAQENLEKADKELRAEVRRRIDELDPPKDGDRVY
jgi:uncharacterized NAD(P)/FAD-binding protein YdhS